MVEGEQQYKQSMASLAESNKSLGTSAGQLGDQVKDLSGKLGIHLPEGATKALNSLQGFSAGTMAAMGAAAGAVALLVKAVKELHEMTMQAAADADELVTQSMKTGLDTRTLQQWQYASELIDVSVETMTGSMTKLTRAMYDAYTGNETLAAAFDNLGVSITDSDGSLRDAESVFLDVVDALGQVENQTERDALAMDIMGRSAQELNPLIVQGSDALRELAEEAEATGYVLDESQIKKLTEVDDAYQRLQLQIESTKKELAVQFAPASQKAMETFSKAVQTAGKILVDSGLIENLASILTSTLSIIDSGASLMDLMPDWLNPINQLSDAFRGLAVIMAMVADYTSAVNSLMHLDFQGVKTALGMNISNGQMNNLQTLRYGNSGWTYNEELGAWNAGGTPNWRGGLTWVGEAGPELVALPQGSRIYSNQESRGMGDQIINITVNGIEQLDEIVRWYDSRRIRGRMA